MHKLVKQAREAGRNLLEHEASALLREYGLPCVPSVLACTVEEAEQAAEEIGFPVVLKMVSPQIIHKSEAGGVKVNLGTKDEVRLAFSEIMASAKSFNKEAELKGVLVTLYLPGGTEVILGMNRDAQFGPVLMFGLGGVFVEVFKDVSFELLPVNEEDAYEMIEGIKGRVILHGTRGQKPKDMAGIAKALVNLSQLVLENPEINEIDLNPTVVFEDKIAILDVRILI